MTINHKKEAVATTVAYSGITEHWFRQRKVFAELTGRLSWVELLFLGIAGKEPPPNCRQLLDELAAVITAADGRIWPLKAGRILASYGHPMVGVATSLLLLEEAPLLGPWTSGAAANVLLQLEREYPDPSPSELRDYIQKVGRLIGWGVALRKQDERYLRLSEAVCDAGRDQLPYWRLHVRISEVMRKEKSLEPNLAIGYGAALLDLGMMAPKSIGLFVSMLCAHLVSAHGIECAERKYPSYLALSAQNVRYIGPEPRALPSCWRSASST